MRGLLFVRKSEEVACHIASAWDANHLNWLGNAAHIHRHGEFG
jgi:hypothetical protein